MKTKLSFRNLVIAVIAVVVHALIVGILIQSFLLSS
jgi:hypothetical protein